MIDAVATADLQKHEVPVEGKGGINALSRLASGFTLLASPDSRPRMFAYGLCIGAATYLLWTSEPPLWRSAGAPSGTIAVWLSLRATRFQGVLFLLVVVSLGAGTGYLAGSLRSLFATSPSVAAETGPVMVEGWLAEIEPGNKGVRLRLDVHAISDLPDHDTPKLVRLTHRSRLEVAPGRFVRCWALLRSPPAPGLPGECDFQRQAWFEQLGAVGYVQGRCRGGTLGAPEDVLDQ